MSGGDYKAPSDMLRSSLRSRGSSEADSECPLYKKYKEMKKAPRKNSKRPGLTGIWINFIMKKMHGG